MMKLRATFVGFVRQGNLPVFHSLSKLTQFQLPPVWRASTYVIGFCWIVLSGSPAQAFVTFEFTYEEVAQETGMGFDDPDQGEIYREILEDVANNVIGSLLDHTANVKIRVDLAEDLPNDTLAQAGQNYFLAPATFQDGSVATHIQTGSTVPGDTMGTMTWDFTHSWHLGEEAPPKTKYDFRSVALHEITHLLGLSSLIKENGRGLKGTFYDTFTRFDSFVENENGLTLIEQGRFNQSPAASLQDLTTATYFDAEHSRAANSGKRVRLYTPDDFERSSIGHLSDSNDPLAHRLKIGTTKRHWSLVDRGILQDIGYHIPDATVTDREEVISSTLLNVEGSLYVGGGQTAAGLAGSLKVNSTASVQVGEYVKMWPTGTLHVDGTLSADGYLVNNGHVEGQGYVATHFYNESGTLSPGSSLGRLTVNRLTQNSTGILEIEISGPAAGSQHDVLQVYETANLAGLLNVKTLNGYTDPTMRGTFDTFTVLEAGNVTGSFAYILYNEEPFSTDVVHEDGTKSMVLGNGYFRNLVQTSQGVTIQNVAAVPGDADGDLSVGLVDFNRLALSFAPFGTGSVLTWEQGNFDGDNDIDVADFNALAIRYHRDVYHVGTGSVLNVPEPSPMVLLWSSSLLILFSSSRICREEKNADSVGLRS